ncbi:phage tail tape measure protein, partial [Pseudomonas aeruginosa]
MPAEKMDQVADVLTAAFTRNNVDIRMLGDSLKYSAGVGREYGQSLETVTTATALLGNAGVQGSMAGTSMRSVLTRLGTSKAVAKLGVQTKDANGNMRDMLDILKDINKKTAGMGNV